jgi:hypothetical protein
MACYGSREATWSFHPSRVQPALELNMLLLLIDRLQREKTLVGERLGALVEAVGVMPVHTLPGRAQIWNRILRATRSHPELVHFLERQLAAYRWEDTDQAEWAFWQHMAVDPGRNRVEELLQGNHPEAPPDLDPALGVGQRKRLLQSYFL